MKICMLCDHPVTDPETGAKSPCCLGPMIEEKEVQNVRA